MKDTGKAIAGVMVAIGAAIAAYYGFYYKLEDGLTAWQKLTGGEKRVDEKDPANGGGIVPPVKPIGLKINKRKPVETKPAPPASTSIYPKGTRVYAGQDMALFSKPEATAEYNKANAKKFSLLGFFENENTAYPGWSKVWITTTFKNPKGDKDVANQWWGFVKTKMITDRSV